MNAAVPIPAIPTMPAFRLPLASLIPSKTNPRKTFTAADIAELADNIKKRGVIQAVLVRPHPSKAEAFEIVCGERRYRASKEAGLVDVPADVRSLSDEEVLEIQLIENLMRRDLTALEEAQGYNAMLAKHYTHEQIAEKVGRSAQYVRDRCRLLNLVKGAMELLQEKKIEVGHAILLARLTPEHQIRTIRPPKRGSYGPERESGLWQAQRDLPGTSEGVDGDREDELKPVSVRELAAWIQDHVRLDPAAAAKTADLFPEVATAVAAAETKVEGGKAPKLVEITTSHQLNDDTRDPKRRVLGRMSWVRADGKAGSKTCANSVLGVVVAGDGQGEAFTICIDKKKCQVHYKREIAARAKNERAVAKSGKTGEDRWALERARQQAETKKREERRKKFEAAMPAIRLAAAEKILQLGPADLRKAITDSLGNDHAAVVEALGAKLPAGKTAEDFIRRVGIVCALAGFYDRWPHEQTLAGTAKRYQVDVEKIIAAQGAPVVEKCRVCGCTETAACRSRKAPTGPMESCSWTEAPNKKTGLGLCSACAEKTGQKASSKSKPKK